MVDRSSVRNVVELPPVINPIRLGVVGLGHRGVGNVICKTVHYDDYRLEAVCDARPEVVRRVVAMVEKDYGKKVRGYTDYDEMLGKEKLDAVAVQVDANVQIPLACQAMEKGLHVMIEVPTAYTIEDCWRLITTVERTGKVFLLMEQIRYSGYIQAWRDIVSKGVIGKPLFVEGEYFGHKTDAFFQDDEGRFYSAEAARNNPKAKYTWRHVMPPIGYLPHELSPLLYVLDDRVVQVVGMATRPRGYLHDNIERSDIQVALMHTEKDVILRMAVGHQTAMMHRGELVGHWHHIKGTLGVLEWQRSDRDKGKLWVENWHLPEPLEVPWSSPRRDAPSEASGSGHGDLDYFTFAYFADAVLRGVPMEFDVYKAVETAAPAILAAKSIAENSRPQMVPDFRPGPHRKPGQMPND